MFDYDWFYGSAFRQQRDEARYRCAAAHFVGMSRSELSEDDNVRQFLSELEVRSLIYLRDGFSYEVKGFAEVDSKSHLTFECEPVDETYKVGAFVVSVPFDEIVRVEAFAVHPSEKPEDSPQITGFRTAGESPEPPPKAHR